MNGLKTIKQMIEIAALIFIAAIWYVAGYFKGRNVERKNRS